ncbi:hypothetical protein A5893_08570 [Pedobacter psychrophilus]|uniref:Uncharacterized protein n=1 Tax=Pedobacter psychrophilus TaxID=1826909 RepID=A0A179DGQ1_9SPHI|nr:hypothetical protein [Pedobacter psychrophilus]OAQ39633.1 hypothetical protein A5893_08570 [Pedobacter psychrophilus]
MRLLKSLFGLSLILIVLSSCGGDEDKKVKEVPKKIAALPAPFKHHEKIEVGPELIFDIYTWGRGADSTSSLLVLRSDSIENDFSLASTNNINGKFKEVFNTDMDDDGNPEVLIYYTANDKFQSAKVICYEFTGKNANEIDFPNLSTKTKDQYHGKDKFYVKEGKLFREFDLFDNNDKEGKKAIDKKVIQYFIKGNRLDLNEVEQ